MLVKQRGVSTKLVRLPDRSWCLHSSVFNTRPQVPGGLEEAMLSSLANAGLKKKKINEKEKCEHLKTLSWHSF